MKNSCFLVLFATQVLYVCPAPTDLSTYGVSENLDPNKTYLQFFNIKDLIEKINIKKFREFQESKANGIEGPTDTAVKEHETTNEAAVAASEDYLPEIDLTEEAIINDKVSVKVPDTDVVANEETTAVPTEAAIVEEAAVTTSQLVVESAVTEAVPVYDDTEVETEASAAALTSAPTENPTTIKSVIEELPNVLPEPSAEDVLLNEIDTGDDKFFISKESVEYAKKYGYKILLKKVNGKEVPVGKIKFSFPTLVEINTDDNREEVPSETLTEGFVDEKMTAETESAVNEAFEEEIVIVTTSASIQVETETEGVVDENIAAETESAVIEVLVEQIAITTGGTAIEVTKTEETTTAAVNNDAESTVNEAFTTASASIQVETETERVVDENIAAETESAVIEVLVEQIAITTGGTVIEVSKKEETTTTAVNNDAETTTTLAVTFLPPPIETIIPTVELLDENTITEGVQQITEDTEVAIHEMKNQNTTNNIVFAECTASFADVEVMLMSLAKNIALQTHQISEILTVGKSLKDETSPELLSRSGAKLLTLLEPLLESLVPAKLSGCAGETSQTMLISLSGMASQLDTIASYEVNQDRATSLHKSATSLQLAAWVMAQLQSSVHTFYSKEGVCGYRDNSTTEILGSLSKAISEYVPIVAMLGNQDSVDELKETIEALAKAQTDIEQLETKSGYSLPGVECGASLSDKAEALENLADFIKALDSNTV